MKNQILLSSLLLIQTLGLMIYTFLAFQSQGPDLFSFFLGNIKELGWNGQFNLDFACYLTLSGLWIMWRHQYRLGAVVFGFAAMILGIIVFAPYLILLLIQHQGDLKKVLSQES